MGTKGKEIVKLDVNELIELMNKAIADEWLAYYQYWLGAKLVKGPLMNEIQKELLEHADEEKLHADMLANRILVLGGIPVINPNMFEKLANCKYEEPNNSSSKKILEQNIAGEQCAISVYQKLINMTKDNDPISHKIFLGILEDEIEHEDDLQNLLEGIE